MKTVVLLALSLVSVPAFADLPRDLADIVEKLGSECSGNDNGTIGRFDVATFNAAEVMRNLKADQRGNDGTCRSSYSRNSSEAVSNLLYTLFDRGSMESDCVNEALSPTEKRKLRAMIVHSSNLGVFSKEWDGDSGDSEYCTYSNYDIYLANGTFVSIVFNHTD